MITAFPPRKPAVGRHEPRAVGPIGAGPRPGRCHGPARAVPGGPASHL